MNWSQGVNKFIGPQASFLQRADAWREELAHQCEPGFGARIVVVGEENYAVTQALVRKNRSTAVEYFELLQTVQNKNPRPHADFVLSGPILHDVSVDSKIRRLKALQALLRDGGKLFIAEYGHQDGALMRGLFRWRQRSACHIGDVAVHSNGWLPGLIETCGFIDVSLVARMATINGSVDIFRCVRTIED